MTKAPSITDYVIEDRGYETPCWIWQLGKGSCGYGVTRRGVGRRQNQPAHRYYYKALVGSLPDDLDLHHLCETRDCVNPAHLEPITTVAHIRRHATLSEEQVAEIRRCYQPRKVTHSMLAEQYGTSRRNIKHIIAGTTWQEVEAA